MKQSVSVVSGAAHTRPRRSSSLAIRPATASDVDAIVELLVTQEFTRPLTRDQLRRLFLHQWQAPRPNHGFVLVDADAIVGVIGTLFSPPRIINGQPQVTLNASTLFILPRYRARRHSGGIVRYSAELIRSLMALGFPTLVFSARGPNDVVPAILDELGFERISASEIFCHPGSSMGTLVRPRGTIHRSPGRLRAALTSDQLALVHDHEMHGCHSMVIEERGRICLVITRRRRYKGAWLWPRSNLNRLRKRSFPVTDVLHLSDPEVALSSWGRFVMHACRIERTVGVTCSSSFFGGTVPMGTPVPQRIFAANRTMPVRSIDKLYSELVLLP